MSHLPPRRPPGSELVCCDHCGIPLGYLTPAELMSPVPLLCDRCTTAPVFGERPGMSRRAKLAAAAAWLTLLAIAALFAYVWVHA